MIIRNVYKKEVKFWHMMRRNLDNEPVAVLQVAKVILKDGSIDNDSRKKDAMRNIDCRFVFFSGRGKKVFATKLDQKSSESMTRSTSH